MTASTLTQHTGRAARRALTQTCDLYAPGAMDSGGGMGALTKAHADVSCRMTERPDAQAVRTETGGQEEAVDAQVLFDDDAPVQPDHEIRITTSGTTRRYTILVLTTPDHTPFINAYVREV